MFLIPSVAVIEKREFAAKSTRTNERLLKILWNIAVTDFIEVGCQPLVNVT